MRANDPNEVEDLIGAALDAAFEGGQQVALLLSQRLIGRKKWIAK
jgi:sulfopyruvate decarboxylase TPP-binding subunit